MNNLYALFYTNIKYNKHILFMIMTYTECLELYHINLVMQYLLYLTMFLKTSAF